jgi:probable HAF family extracellular repeat protein
MMSVGDSYDPSTLNSVIFQRRHSNEYALNSGASGTFLYTNGTMTTLPSPGSSLGYGSAINDNGEIAGFLFVTSGQYHAAKFSNAVWTDLDVITGAAQNEAKGINASGQIVGTSVLPSTYKTLIPSGTGFTLTDAVAINESGQILCDATNASA